MAAPELNDLAVRRLGPNLTSAEGPFSIEYDVRDGHVQLARVTLEPGATRQEACPTSFDVRVGAAEIDRFAIAVLAAELKAGARPPGRTG
jgi:hypothetical protein